MTDRFGKPLMQMLLRTIIVACLAALAMVPTLTASVFEAKKDLHISNLHQIDDDLYVWGEKLQMDGTIAGDLVVFCYDARMAGVVGGSANFFARSVRQSGSVIHSLRTFSEQATIEGSISGSYVGVGSRIDVAKGALIERDLTVYAADANIEGVVRGKATLRGGRITIAGTIEGDVFIRAEKISIIPPAVIRGALVYESKKQEALDTTSGILLVGGVTWQQPKSEEKTDETPNYIKNLVYEIAGLVAAFVFGIIMLLLFRPYTIAAVDELNRRTSVAFATGLLSLGMLLVATVVLAIAAFITIAGLFMVSGSTPVVGAIFLLFSALLLPVSSLAAMLGVITFYAAKIIVAIVLGALIMRQAQRAEARSSKLGMLVGLAILTVLFAIPYVGWIFWLASALPGAGALVLGVRACRAQLPSASTGVSAEVNPPPAS